MDRFNITNALGVVSRERKFYLILVPGAVADTWNIEPALPALRSILKLPLAASQ